MNKISTMLRLCTLLAVFAAAVKADDYTITSEVVFEVEVEDLDGPGNNYKGQFTIGVFGSQTPMTALNFEKLARGHKKDGKELTYSGTNVHRVVPDFVIQMGDVLDGDGNGAISIYGDRFDDEDFDLSHSAPGIVAMANHGKNTNGCQFYILLNKARWLDGKHVVFGKVIQGMDVIRTLGEVPSDPNTAVPDNKITITKSSVIDLDRKYQITQEQYDSAEDI